MEINEGDMELRWYAFSKKDETKDRSDYTKLIGFGLPPYSKYGRNDWGKCMEKNTIMGVWSL